MPTADQVRQDLYDTTTPTTTASLRQRIVQEALRQGVDPALMLALFQHESGLNPNAVSPTGVTGLAQVTIPTGTPHGQTAATRRNPDVSMQAGMAYFKQLLGETQGDTREALRRYGDPNVANYPDLVYSNYASQAADVPQNAKTQRLMAQTQRSMQPRQGTQGQAQRQAPGADPSAEELGRSLGYTVAPVPQPAPSAPPPASPPAAPGFTPVDISPPTGSAGAAPEGDIPKQPPAPPSRPGTALQQMRPVMEGDILSDVGTPTPPAGAEPVRQLDPRTMDDDALLRQIGVDPALVKQSKLYRPGNFQQALLQPDSVMESLMRSRGGELLEGFGSVPLGMAQIAAHGASALGLTSPADTAYVDALIKLRRMEYSQTPRGTVDIPVLGAVSPVEMAGQALFPVPGARRVLARNPTGSFLANTGRSVVNATVGGGIGGFVQPVYDPGTTYGAQKAGQAGGGAAVGLTLGALLAAGQAGLGVNRAAQAVERAEQGTAEDLAAYAQRQRERAFQSGAAQSQAEAATSLAREQQHAKWLGDMREYSDRVATADRLVEQANADAQTAYATQGREAYQAALDKLRTAEAERQTAVRARDTAVAAHQAEATRLQALPERYAPQMPQRTLGDVMRDQRLLEQGGAAEEAVIQRLGAEDIFDAFRLLHEEGKTYRQAGQPMPAPAGAPVAASFREPPLSGMQVEQPPTILRWIKQQGDIRLQGEELASEFAPLTQGYVNNRTGKTVDQLAQAAHEQGLIASPDKTALLEEIRRTRLHQQQPDIPAPAPPAPAVPEAPDLGGGKVSSRLYARFDEAGARTPVDFTPAKNAVAEVRDQLGMVPPSGQPTVIQKIAKDIDDMGTQGNASQAYEIMKSLGKALRSADGKTRYLAQQVFEGVTSSMEQSAPPELLTMLEQAKTAWKAEQGVNLLHDLFGRRKGGAIIRENAQGELVVNVQGLLNSIKDKAQREQLTRWFGPQQYANLVSDVEASIGLPAIPKGEPLRTPDLGAMPGLVDITKIGEGGQPPPVQTLWDIPARQREGITPAQLRDIPQTPPPVEQGRVAPTPFEPPPPPRAPTLEQSSMWRAATERAFPLAVGAATGASSLGLGAALPAAVVADRINYGLAHVLLSESGRPLLQHIMQNGGVISPGVAAQLGYLGGAASTRPEQRTERAQRIDELQRRARERLRGGQR